VANKQIAKSRQDQRIDVGVDLLGPFFRAAASICFLLASRNENRPIWGSPKQASGALHRSEQGAAARKLGENRMSEGIRICAPPAEVGRIFLLNPRMNLRLVS